MTSPDDTEYGALSGNVGKGDIEIGRDLLTRFSQKWRVAGDLAGTATIRDVDRWDATKEIERIMTVTESTETITKPPEAAPDREDAVPMDERYDHAPEEYESTRVDFVDFEGASLIRCTTCGGSGRKACDTCDRQTVIECDECRGNSTTACGSCSGDGTLSCSRCDGSGNNGDATCPRCNGSGDIVCETCNGTGERQCPKCDGAGDVKCPDCAGEGDVPCDTCSGGGELYRTTRGTLKYEPDSSFTIDDPRGADDEWFADVDGDRLSQSVSDTPDRADDSGSATVRHEVEQRAVPVTKVTYEYNGGEHALYDVGGTLQSHSYPKSTTRRLLPIVIGVILAIGGGYYYFVVM